MLSVVWWISVSVKFNFLFVYCFKVYSFYINNYFAHLQVNLHYYHHSTSLYLFVPGQKSLPWYNIWYCIGLIVVCFQNFVRIYLSVNQNDNSYCKNTENLGQKTFKDNDKILKSPNKNFPIWLQQWPCLKSNHLFKAMYSNMMKINWTNSFDQGESNLQATNKATVFGTLNKL